jgi:hypothetical protein
MILVIFGLVYQKIFKKSIFRVIEQKILFFENLMRYKIWAKKEMANLGILTN